MTRRLLERSRGVIVHSHFMEDEIRQAGFTGPVAVIPHGAWIPEADRHGYRYRLGLDEIHAAGRHLRISETVQADRRIAARLPPAGASGARRRG